MKKVVNNYKKSKLNITFLLIFLFLTVFSPPSANAWFWEIWAAAQAVRTATDFVHDVNSLPRQNPVHPEIDDVTKRAILNSLQDGPSYVKGTPATTKEGLVNLDDLELAQKRFAELTATTKKDLVNFDTLNFSIKDNKLSINKLATCNCKGRAKNVPEGG